MRKSKFKRGQKVRILPSAKTPELAARVREKSHGTVDDVFEVVSCDPPLEIRGELVAASYWVTPTGDGQSTVCIDARDLVDAKHQPDRAALEDDDMSLPDVDID